MSKYDKSDRLSSLEEYDLATGNPEYIDRLSSGVYGWDRQKDYWNTKIENEKSRKQEEIEANIPKRALMLQKASDDILTLPQLPSVLWKEIAEYEGGVESSVLGEWPWCTIL